MDEGWTGTRPLLLDGGAVPEAERERAGFVDRLPSGTRRPLLEGFMLAMPPSANVYWRTAAQYSRKQERWVVTTYPSEEAKAYKEHVAEVITNGRKRHWSDNPLRVQMVTCFASNGRADIDNRVKPLLDALKDAQVFKDDCQVWELEVRRGPVVKGGRIVLSVWEILPDQVGALTWVKQRA